MFSSPHSGRAYSSEFLALTRLNLAALRRSEDCFIDEIFGAGPELGATLIAAEFPRAWCDVNREAWELDPGMFDDTLPEWVNTTSPRVAAGLGTLARVVSNGEAIYRGKLRFADAEARVAECWEPYHASLERLIAAAQTRFGAAVLIDCHSMPAHACQDRRPVPDIVLGDAHGVACTPALLRAVDQWLTRRGYVVRRNDPYAGGYITRHYGRPARQTGSCPSRSSSPAGSTWTSCRNVGQITRASAKPAPTWSTSPGFSSMRPSRSSGRRSFRILSQARRLRDRPG